MMTLRICFGGGSWEVREAKKASPLELSLKLEAGTSLSGSLEDRLAQAAPSVLGRFASEQEADAFVHRLQGTDDHLKNEALALVRERVAISARFWNGPTNMFFPTTRLKERSTICNFRRTGKRSDDY